MRSERRRAVAVAIGASRGRRRGVVSRDITCYGHKHFGSFGNVGAGGWRVSCALVCENKASNDSAYSRDAVLFRVCLFLAFV